MTLTTALLKAWLVIMFLPILAIVLAIAALNIFIYLITFGNVFLEIKVYDEDLL